MGWTVWGSNPGGGEIFRSCPDQPWGPPSLLYNGYRVSFPGVKWPGCGVDHLPSSSARVKERVELYLYCPVRPSWPFLGRTLPFTFTITLIVMCFRSPQPVIQNLYTSLSWYNYSTFILLCSFRNARHTLSFPFIGIFNLGSLNKTLYSNKIKKSSKNYYWKLMD
jgi:hypothetical protein